jgi:hypothetical protein
MIRAVVIVVIVVLAVHGLIHVSGFAKAFQLAELPQLKEPISRWLGVLWLVAGLLVLATATLLPLAPRWWWAVGAAGLILSQALIFSSWGDAKFGTVLNVVLLVAVAYGFAARGPWSLREEYERDVALAAGSARSDEVLAEADLAPLPEPVRRYLRGAGVVGQPRVQNLHATWTGRIRGGPTEAWMTFTAQQVNAFDPPRRFFLMDAVMKGLPVDVLHAFDEAGATMRVRLLSVKTMVDARGDVLTRAETVTLFNDLCFLAPGELVRSSVAWEPVDAHTARARYTQGANTISATLVFNDAAELVDFSSEDRSPSPDRSTGPMRWTTPARDYAPMGPARVLHQAETKWHPEGGAWTYGEFTLTGLAYNVVR